MYIIMIIISTLLIVAYFIGIINLITLAASLEILRIRLINDRITFLFNLFMYKIILPVLLSLIIFCTVLECYTLLKIIWTGGM